MNRAAFLLFPVVSTLSLLAKHATPDSQTGNSLHKSPADRNSVEKSGAWKMRAIASPAGLRRGVQSRPAHLGIENRTPHEAFLAYAVLTKDEALNLQISG
jgi:hypothetical protein